MGEEYLTVQEIAKKYRISRMTVYRAIHNESLRAVRFGRTFRVPASALWDYFDNSMDNYPNHRPEGVEEE